MQLINTELGQNDWQNATGRRHRHHAGAGAGGATRWIKRPSGTFGCRSSRRLTLATYGLESVAVHTLTRYAAASANNVFTEAEWLAGNTSDTAAITFPATSANHFKGFAIPASEVSLTSIQQVGNPFDERGSFLPAVGDADVLVDIGSESHKTYIAQSLDFGGFAVDYELR